MISNEQKSRELFWQSLNDEEKRRNVEHGFMAMCEHHKALTDAYTKGGTSLSAQNKPTMEALLKNSCKDLLRVLQSKPAFFESLKQEFASKMNKKPSPQLVELISE